jgi:hypothetical protein
MRNAKVAAAILGGLVGCAVDPSVPIDLEGTFVGAYTVTSHPGLRFQGSLELTQRGSAVTGFFSSSSGRSAGVTGTVAGTQLTMTYSFTDGCHGSASATADITYLGAKLVGSYAASDCTGSYSGGFDLARQ